MKQQPFKEMLWDNVTDVFDFTDITYHLSKDKKTARIAFNRPECRNAFRPKTVDELLTALSDCHQNIELGCVLLTGNGPSPKDGGYS